MVPRGRMIHRGGMVPEGRMVPRRGNGAQG